MTSKDSLLPCYTKDYCLQIKPLFDAAFQLQNKFRKASTTNPFLFIPIPMEGSRQHPLTCQGNISTLKRCVFCCVSRGLPSLDPWVLSVTFLSISPSIHALFHPRGLGQLPAQQDALSLVRIERGLSASLALCCFPQPLWRQLCLPSCTPSLIPMRFASTST